jgi:hypothetical protein
MLALVVHPFVKLVYMVLYGILCDILAILQDHVPDFMWFTNN